MHIKDFVHAFPNISLRDMFENSDTLKSELLWMYNKIEMIWLNYNLDDLHQDQIRSLIQDISEVVALIKK